MAVNTNLPVWNIVWLERLALAISRLVEQHLSVLVRELHPSVILVDGCNDVISLHCYLIASLVNGKSREDRLWKDYKAVLLGKCCSGSCLNPYYLAAKNLQSDGFSSIGRSALDRYSYKSVVDSVIFGRGQCRCQDKSSCN